MILRGTLAVAAFLGLIDAHASETMVLGMPLGSKVSIAGTCAEIGSLKEPKAPCWVGRPFVSATGSRLGGAQYPGASKRPAWAQYVTLELLVAKNGVLESIKVWHPTYDERQKIAASIRERWGLATAVVNLPNEGISAAEWIGSDAVVKMNCSQRAGCYIEFISPAAYTARNAALAQQKAADAKRPTAP